MSITILPITDHEMYEINGHLIYKDDLNNWICKSVLSEKEYFAFNLYMLIVIENPRFKKHIKSTYLN
ncbi:hypothetical protein [Flavobacterium panacagri]|uniref:hypothetical protein n=1 Tax=Flavobacterium panacagri TaxID=3034146 RepID=UPI0025A65FD5|nr:hypothetical protein [Flavobacterium panacagri]